MLSGVERFLVEFLRLNPPWLAGLTEAQWVAMATVTLSLVIMAVIPRRPPACMPAGGGTISTSPRGSRA